jgi:hypothetical protein
VGEQLDEKHQFDEKGNKNSHRNPKTKSVTQMSLHLKDTGAESPVWSQGFLRDL